MIGKWQKVMLCLLVLALVFAFPVQAKEDLNASCPAYSFTDINGKTITNSTNFGKTTLIIFTLTVYHGHEDSMISDLLNAPWINAQDLRVLMVSAADTTKEDLRDYTKTNGAENSALTFCMDENDAMSDLMCAAGWDPYTFSIPLCFVIDRNGRLQRASMGDSSEMAFQQLLEGYVADVPPVKKATVSIEGQKGYAEAFEILRLLNIERAKEGLSALKMDPDLLEAAMQRAAECSVYYSHTRPNGESCFTAFPDDGASGKAENIAIGYRSAAAVMDGWMNSSGHRKNILTANFASAGIGVFYHNGGYSWVQLFSTANGEDMKTPADQTVTAKVETLEEHVMLQVNPRQMMLKKGATKTIDLHFYNTEFPYLPVQLSSSCLSFRSENTAIAKVDANGKVTAVSKGTTRITVEVKNSNLSATFSVTVGDHTYFESVPKEPTCGETGLGEYICEECGDFITAEIPKLTTHTWNTGKVTRYPTENQAGVRTYTCTVCSATKTESIPKLGAQATQPVTKPTTAPTAAPTVSATKAPTVPVVTQPTTLPTQAATIPATQPATLQPTTAITQPSQLVTNPTELPIPIPEPTDEPTEPESLPSELETTQPQPIESSPEFQPDTQPTEAATQQTTQLPTQPEDAPTPDADNKLAIGVVVAVAAILAAGAFLLFWKKKK